MASITTTSASAALQQPFENQAWVLPDNSLVLLCNAGTINFSGTNTNHTILLQSTNWQSGSPTFSFVKQITSTAQQLAASYWDGTRLHIAYAGSTANSTTGLFYISASYSSGTWTWDSGATTLLAASDPTNNASSPAIIADATGAVYVAYRNSTVAGSVVSVCMFTRVAGVWNSSPVQLSATSGTATSRYGALSYGNNTVLLVTHENGSYYALTHPDSGAWGSATAGPTPQISTGQQYGPHSVIADGSHGAWVGISSTTGMKVNHLTWSGTTVIWDATLITLDSANNVSAPQWLYYNGILVGYYFKTTATNTADLYGVQYSPTTGLWNTPTNITNNSANNNVNPIVPANFTYSTQVPVAPYIYETGTASPFTLNIGLRYKPTNLLPGQKLVNGVSTYLFGSNLGNPQSNKGVLVTGSPIQQTIKNGNFQVMRCFANASLADSFIDKEVLAAHACGVTKMLFVLSLDTANQAWNNHLISYLLSTYPSDTFMFEYGNEPDGASKGHLTGSQYYTGYTNSTGTYTGWSTAIPALRQAFPTTAFIGPTITYAPLSTTWLSDWLTPCLSAGGAMLPDAISFHHYPCTTIPKNPTACTLLSSHIFSDDCATINSQVSGVFGYTLPICMSEWNIAGGGSSPYMLDYTYASNWVHAAIDSMVAGGMALACQFEAGNGDGGAITGGEVPDGTGWLDMVSSVSPYPPSFDYQPIVDKILQYLGSPTPHTLLTVNRRSGTGIAAINRRDGTGTGAISRRSGTGTTTKRRDGTGTTVKRRDGTGTTTNRRG